MLKLVDVLIVFGPSASVTYLSIIIYFTFRNHYKFGQSLEASEDSVSRLSIRRETLCAVIVHGYGSRGNDSMSLVLRDGTYIIYPFKFGYIQLDCKNI